MSKTSGIHIFDLLLSQGSWPIKCLKLIDYMIGTAIVFILPCQKKSVLQPKDKIKKILVIRPGGIGDAVFLLPILKVLRNDLSIEILCEKRNEEVFRSQGYNVFLLNSASSWLSLMRNSYDVVIDTEQWHFLSGILSYFLRTNHRIGFASRPFRSKLFNRDVIYKENEYELGNFISLFEGLLPDAQEMRIAFSFEVSVNAKAWASSQIPERSISLFLGASIPLRRFGKEQVLEVIQNLEPKGYSVVLIGGKDVSDLAADIAKSFPQGRIFNFAGGCSLMESAALIQRSSKLISPDSGLMHLACAIGVPVIAVFGPGNLLKWSPRESCDQIVTANVSCSPCTRFGYTIPTCQGSFHCMKVKPVLDHL